MRAPLTGRPSRELLARACLDDDRARVLALLDQGADPFIPDPRGDDAAMVAAKAASAQALNALLERHGALALVKRYGRSALGHAIAGRHWACAGAIGLAIERQGASHAARSLASDGAMIAMDLDEPAALECLLPLWRALWEPQDPFGCPLLWLAAEQAAPNMARELLAREGFGRADRAGRDALMQCADSCSGERGAQTAEILAFAANPAARDLQGQSALDLALDPQVQAAIERAFLARESATAARAPAGRL